MADCTVAQVMSDAAALVGDEAMEQFTSAVQLPWFGFAFRELYDICQRWRLPMGKREAYGLVPAYTNVIAPSQMGITDMGEPIALWERSGATALAITGATNATPIEITTSVAHGLSTNAEVDITGVVGAVGANGNWFITVTGATTFTLNGSIAGGVYSSGGSVLSSSQKWDPVTEVDSLPDTEPDATLRFWKWENDRLYFVGASQVTELKLSYTTSGAAPASGNIGVDNARNFLALRTASLLADNYDMLQRAKTLKEESFGPSMTPDGTGGALRNLVGPMLLEKQNTIKRPGTFRPRRNAVSRLWW